MPLTEIKQPARRFLGESGETVYTVVPDGLGTWIVIHNDAYGDVYVAHQNISISDLKTIYNIEL